MNKLRKVEYFVIEGKLKAVELYEDDSIRFVEVKNGVVDYILNEDTSQGKDEVKD